jgi:CPA2 family monovalent cation:H+ antiporter-2
MSTGHNFGATFRHGRIELDEPQDWPDGLRLQIKPVYPLCDISPDGHVIIVGFGLAGRCVADLLDQAGLPYIVVEKNEVTVETQRALGRTVVSGSAADVHTLMQAGLESASILALTIPDEEAVCQATAVARRLRPDIYIIARTNYASQGMRASQLGADEVIKAEQAVAFQFYDKLSARLGRLSTNLSHAR